MAFDKVFLIIPAPQRPTAAASATSNSTSSLDKNSISETSTTPSVQRANLVEKYGLGWIFEKGSTKQATAVVCSVIENKAEVHLNEAHQTETYQTEVHHTEIHQNEARQNEPQEPHQNEQHRVEGISMGESSEGEIVTQEQIMEAEEEYVAGVKQKIELFEKNPNFKDLKGYVFDNM